MRGSRAKRLRREAYGEGALKYPNNRTYQTVVCPGQHRHPVAMTKIADEYRFYYQFLKGRRKLPND